MSKNPFINAGAAAAYIGLVVFIIFGFADKVEHRIPENLIFLMPLTMISLFTLSASVMGYLFLYEPSLMILDGKRAEGAKLFLQTVAIFAMFVAIVVGILLFYSTGSIVRE